MKRIRIGDVYQIECEGTYAYAQYTHRGSQMGPLLQMPRIRYRSKQNNPKLDITNQTLSVFFPINPILRAGLITLIGNFPIPTSLRPHPRLLSHIPPIRPDDIPKPPSVWDGEKYTNPILGEDLSKLSRYCAASFPTLVDWIREFPVVD